MIKSVFASLKGIFDLKGRAPRAEYIVYIVFCWLFTLPVGSFGGDMARYGAFASLMLALQVRRLHDFAVSGAWLLLFAFPAVAVVFPYASGPFDPAFLLQAMAWALVLLSVMFAGGVGGNQYGPDPQAVPSSQAFGGPQAFGGMTLDARLEMTGKAKAFERALQKGDENTLKGLLFDMAYSADEVSRQAQDLLVTTAEAEE